ncbi:reverse transcriptase domain-containing protein [Micrococcaceae bacterium Sec5.1]
MEFLDEVRELLKSRAFVPLPVRERMIPKPGSTKLRRLGIPTARDRVVQASLALVLEPIFEADFKPVSYGFRPKRRAQDAIAEIHAMGTRRYHWVFEAHIQACFDELKHSAVIAEVSKRVIDRRVLSPTHALIGLSASSGRSGDSIRNPIIAPISMVSVHSNPRTSSSHAEVRKDSRVTREVPALPPDREVRAQTSRMPGKD